MQNPTVSFIVPCYNLAHLLPDCINSILSQSFRDFEVLIMDDCSPDNTAEIAQSFRDPRIKHIRNDQNLGHLQNYNKGISMAEGKYVWLISADDRLRRYYVLERYVGLMENHPEVGYVFCAGLGLQDCNETKLLDDYYYGSEDKIFDGRQFIATVLFKSGGLLSPSVMVRKNCYEKIGMFPLDMPHQGDMYLWFAWALEYNVAYLSEPMVNYRDHDLNMNKDLMNNVPMTVFTDVVNVLWRTKRKAEQKGFDILAQIIEYFIAHNYADMAESTVYGGKYSHSKMDIAQCDEALCDNAVDELEYARIRGKFFSLMAINDWRNGSFKNARQRMSYAGEYSGALNVVNEMLCSSDWKHAEISKIARFRLMAALIYWCQRRFAMSILAFGHVVLTYPTILGRPLKIVQRWLRLAIRRERSV